jgi:hypothetical protein
VVRKWQLLLQKKCPTRFVFRKNGISGFIFGPFGGKNIWRKKTDFYEKTKTLIQGFLFNNPKQIG